LCEFIRRVALLQLNLVRSKLKKKNANKNLYEKMLPQLNAKRIEPGSVSNNQYFVLAFMSLTTFYSFPLTSYK